MGLTSTRNYFQMNPTQFGHFIRAHHETLVNELSAVGISYDALSPALVPTTGDRHEMALLFNIEHVSNGMYGHAVAEVLIPLLNRKSTLSVLAGDIGLPPEKTKQLALVAGFNSNPSTDEWGRQFIYCVYLSNVSAGQRDEIHAALQSEEMYLGYVPCTYTSDFRTVAGTMVATRFLKHKHTVLVDHGSDDPWVSSENEIGYPFKENNYTVVSVNSQLFSPLLGYKIPSKVYPEYRDDVLVSLNAISENPLALNGFEVLLDEGKYGYLRDCKDGLLRIAGLDELSREDLAAVIRAELSNGYIYRLQHNVDETVQFGIVLELHREQDHPVKVAVGLKYFPDTRELSLVTLT